MKTEIFSYSKFLLYSFGIAILWRITFLWSVKNTDVNCFVGLMITLISTYWIQVESKKELTTSKKIILFIFPSIFLYTLYDKEFFEYNFFGAHFIGILVMFLNLFLLKDLKKYGISIFFFLLIYFYSFVKYPGWQAYRYENWRGEAIVLSSAKTNDSVDINLNINEYSFINTKLDTVKISSPKKYTLFITWSEYCKYCKSAFKNMNPILDTIDKIDTYYIYSSPQFNSDKFLESYKKEKELNDRNVLADYESKFIKKSRFWGRSNLCCFG